MFIASILITINIVKLNTKCENKIIYRYIPNNYNQDPDDDINVSKVFEKLFEKPSTWIERVIEPDREAMSENNYFITQG